MKQNNILVSIVLTTYNRDQSLKNAIDVILDQSYKNLEIIVTDDGETNIAKDIVSSYEDQNILYTKNNTPRGYLNNLKNGISKCKGDIIMHHSDDDEMVDTNYITYAIDTFKKNSDVDIVFGRFKTITKEREFTDNYNHKAYYSNEEFIKNWINIMEHITFSTICFKSDLLKNDKIMSSIYPKAASTDFSIILKAASFSKKIAFIDKIGYAWNVSSDDSLSGENYDDLTYQAMSLLTCAVDVSLLAKIEKSPISEDIAKQSMNQYSDYMFNAIIDNYMLNNNNYNFINLLKNYDLLNKPVYIYGKGKLGLALKSFLNSKDIEIVSFIDDIRKESDTISLSEFTNKEKKDIFVIIGTYKYKYAYNIFKNLSHLKNVEVLDVFYKEIG